MPGDNDGPKTPGVQGIIAVCEVTGGGEKVYAIAVQYDVEIDPASLALDTFATGVVPAADGYFPGMPSGPDKDATTKSAAPREPKAIYTNAQAAIRADQTSAHGDYVIV